MRLLSTADLHYRPPQFDWLVEQSADVDVDVVVIPGDHRQVIGAAPLEVQIVVISKFCCGHIHQAPWVDGGGWIDQRGSTWMINAGHQPGPMPAHVMIDLDEGTAEWIALPERQVVEMRP